MVTADLFKNEGNIISVEGNSPLKLTDPGYVWVVDQGKVSVFSVWIIDGEAAGSRDFLFETWPGDILFGIIPEGKDKKYGLLVSGLTGTRLMQIPRARFFDLAEKSADKEIIAGKIKRWVDTLLKITSGAADVAPVDLDGFNSLALLAAIQRRQEREQADQLRFQEKSDNDRRYMENAINSLLAVANPKQTKSSLAEASGDPLLDACRMVGREMKIRIVVPPPSAGAAPSKDPLGEIARASRIRVRQVALKGEWWKEDNGPLLAYMEEDNRPVALLPLSPSRYRLHDPFGVTGAPVGFNVARQVKPFAFAFYRPFPEKVLTLRDIFIMGYESSRKQDFAMVILMGVLGGLLGMVVPVATGLVFDTVIPGGEKAQLMHIAFFLGASAVAAMFFQLTRSFAMLRIEGRMEGSVQAAVWDRLLSLPVPFFRGYTSGELAMRAMGISQIRVILSGVTITTIISSIFSCFNLFLIFYYDIKLAAIASLLIAISVAVVAFLGIRQIRFERQVIDITNKISGLVLQLIGGVSKFRVAGAEKRAFHLWSGEFGKQRMLVFKKETITNYMETFNSVLPATTSIIVFYLVATKSSLPPGKFIAFNAAFTSFLTSMIALSQSLIAINVIIPLYERAKPILETMPEYDDVKSDPGELTGAIEVSHLYFRYKEDGPLVLNDVSFQIGEGEYVGLVGPSGSGKSTLFRVLLGFEKPESGRIYYSGQDIEKVDIRLLRRQLGVVLQNGKLLSGDIFSNIVGSKPNLTMDDAIEAAKMAGLEGDISEMPMGMHTVISEGAGTLSGGQRQRLLVARAIVGKPKILFFDEATSALDNQTQAVVSRSLDRLKATRVVIAHRLSTIINCDRIIVMDRGRIIEEGSYEELMKMNGVFSDLARRQLA